MLVIETIIGKEMMGSPQMVDLGKIRSNSDLGFHAGFRISFLT